jgi:hypothetical protein
MVGLYSHARFRINEQSVDKSRKRIKNDKPKPSWANYAHVWLGRSLLIAGIVNGGLGLQLTADSTQGQKLIYIMFAVVMGMVYLTTILVWIMESRRKAATLSRRQKGVPNPQDVPLHSIKTYD